MKTYKIMASYKTYVYTFVNAESQDEALQIAKDLDGGDFSEEKDCLGDWNIDGIVEVNHA